MASTNFKYNILSLVKSKASKSAEKARFVRKIALDFYADITMHEFCTVSVKWTVSIDFVHTLVKSALCSWFFKDNLLNKRYWKIWFSLKCKNIRKLQENIFNLGVGRKTLLTSFGCPLFSSVEQQESSLFLQNC